MEDDEQAGFSISKVDYSPPRPVVHMVTSNNILVMALDNGKLIRLDLRDTSELRGTYFCLRLPFLHYPACLLAEPVQLPPEFYAFASIRREGKTIGAVFSFGF